MIIKESLMWAIDELKKNDVSESVGSAALLLANILGKDRAFIYAHGEEELSDKQSKLFKKYIERRKTHEPVWYILGEVEFYGRKFYINNDVLTPRPETEILLQEVLKSISNIQFPISNVIELGTGSGIIAITLAKESGFYSSSGAKRSREASNSSSRIPRTIIATDISAKALMVARKNAKIHGVEKDIEFLQSDLLEPIGPVIPRREESLTTSPDHSRWGSFLRQDDNWGDTIIIANLPYIPHEDMESLQFDVLHHEPRVALDGGEKGVEIYERLIAQMKELGFSGTAFFEIGIGQGKLITNIVQKYFPKAKVIIKKDLADIDRIAVVDITQN